MGQLGRGSPACYHTHIDRIRHIGAAGTPHGRQFGKPLSGGGDGVAGGDARGKGRVALPKAEDLDGLENIRATRHAPASSTRALDALEKNRLLTDAIGSLLIEAHLVMKRDEVKRLAGRSKEDIRDYYIPFI